jgi:hypothetical protein
MYRLQTYRRGTIDFLLVRCDEKVDCLVMPLYWTVIHQLVARMSIRAGVSVVAAEGSRDNKARSHDCSGVQEPLNASTCLACLTGSDPAPNLT